MRKEFLRVLAVAAALQGAVLSQEAVAEEPTPGFNNKIPESVLTPDTVETRIGTLSSLMGSPTRRPPPRSLPTWTSIAVCKPY